jgi:hypothetical protein
VLQRPFESRQYVSIHYTVRLADAGIDPSVGSVGDSYDNALAETVNGLFKTGVIRRRGPWRSLEAVEFAVLLSSKGSTGSTIAAFSSQWPRQMISYGLSNGFSDPWYKSEDCRVALDLSDFVRRNERRDRWLVVRGRPQVLRLRRPACQRRFESDPLWR